MAELTTPLPRERALTLNWSKLLGFAAFLVIVVLQVLGNLYWIARNVVPIGRDAGGHLLLALEYTQILDRLTLQSLFTALTYHDFRPPALYMATQVPYRFFGYSMDAAQMVNVALLIPILGLTFLLGRRLVGEHAGLLAVALTAFFPMMAAMTRLFYLENFHTTMVLAVLFCLLKSEGFASRRWAVLWGVSLGVGLLVKWALPTFVFLPILVAVWRSGIVRMQWESMRRPRVDPRALGVALFAAVLLASLWYFPNRARALALPLRDWLLVVWIVLLTVAFYALGRPSRPLTNCWAGLFVGLSVASLWYAARIDFVAPFIETAYGTYGGHFEAFDPRRLNNYVRYPRLFVTHHLGPLASLVVLPAGLLPWLARRRLGDPVAARLENAPVVAWLLWAGLLSAYLITAFSSQTGERNIVPVLPIVALLLAGGLARYPRRLALGFGLVWIGILALQWSIFTFDRMAPFHRATEPLWADGEFLVRPASGATDPAYWIAPNVLREVQSRHDPDAAADSTLGMLVNSHEIHRGPFNYLARLDYRDVEIVALTEPDGDAWPQTVRSQWLLTKDGDNHDVEAPGLRALAEIYGNPTGLFPLLFTEVMRYPLPDSETATLWRRSVGTAFPPYASQALVPLGETLRAMLPEAEGSQGQHEAILLLGDAEQALTLGQLDLMPRRVALMPGMRPEEPVVFALLHEGQASDPAVMAWLQEHYYPAYDSWFESEYLTVWGRPTDRMLPRPVGHQFGPASLATMTTVRTARAGGVVPVELQWEHIGPAPLKVSLRLLDAAGASVAQLDRDLQPDMRLGLFLPPGTPAGQYSVAASLYDPATLEALADAAGNTMVPLAEVEVQ